MTTELTKMIFESKERIDELLVKLIDRPVKKDGKTVGVVTNAYLDETGNVIGELSLLDGTKKLSILIPHTSIKLKEKDDDTKPKEEA